MMKFILVLLVATLTTTSAAIATADSYAKSAIDAGCDVTQQCHGTKGDNHTEATGALHFIAAIAACQGHGAVIVPPDHNII